MLRDINIEFLKPAQAEQSLPKIGLWTTLSGFGLVGTVLSLFSLAAIMPYNDIVRANATVRPVGELRMVQAEVAGTVRQVNVKENQVVKKGEAIALVDYADTRTRQQQLEAAIVGVRQQFNQITAQVAALDRQIASESNVTDLEIASSEADLSRNQRDYQQRQVTTDSQYQEAQSALDFAQLEMQRYQKLARKGAISDLQIRSKEQAFQLAQAKLAQMAAALDPSEAPVIIAQRKIAQTRAQGLSTIATLRRERENLIQRQVELQSQFQRDRQALNQASRDLRKSVVVAPVDGTVLKLDLRNPGQVVQVGDRIAQIVPKNASLVIKAQVLAQDIANVKICQAETGADCEAGQAQLRISAYPYPDYGVLKGAVRSISGDTVSPQSAFPGGAGTPAYEVTIYPDKTYLQRPNYSGDKRYPLQPGMDVTADITAQKETYLKFILRKVRLLTEL